MAEVTYLDGIIRNLRYTPSLVPKLTEYSIDDFDINEVKGYGIVRFGSNAIGYSKWISPKRTRSYPYARIYDSYSMGKRVTIIPIIKDEGINGDNDRINIITLSLMNLLNVFVVLAWYDDARRHPRRVGKITHQRMSTDYVREQLLEINAYQQTALHWNLMHFSRDFEQVYRNAVESYKRIGSNTGTVMHSERDHLAVLESFVVDGSFDVNAFSDISLERSQGAARRETLTRHMQEYLQDGGKAYLFLKNYMGGTYHLTADEVFYEDDKLVLQESKNTTKNSIPTLSDIKDGLLKLILFSNIDELRLSGQHVNFMVRLKLTGKIKGSLHLPASPDVIRAFTNANAFTKSRCAVLDLLNQETLVNAPLRILITGNQ